VHTLPRAHILPHFTVSNNNPDACLPACLQDPLFAPNYHLPMPAFRELTSRRVQAFVDQRLFSVFDYVRDPLKFQVGAVPVCAALRCTVPVCAVLRRGGLCCAWCAGHTAASRQGAWQPCPALAAVFRLAEFGAQGPTSRQPCPSPSTSTHCSSVMSHTRPPCLLQAALECLSFCDYSLAIKSGVHFTLCGGTIAKLGTEKHHG
jgi:hypothetical protein